ncbi:MAG: CvpA family protein [Alphaproteobacteria bacterium]|nr:CvpA family protein [Alphaproteobacteria bacterium]
MEQLNNIDVVILIGFAISMLVAFIRGFVKEVLSILGLALFVIIAIYLIPVMEPWMSKYIANAAMAKFVIFLIVLAVFYAIWIISTDKLIAKIRTSTLSFMDRLFGLLFGFLRAVLILGFCFILVKIALPEELKSGSLKESKYFMMAEGGANLIEKLLPEDFVKDTMKSVEDLNKAEKKPQKDKEEKKKEDKTKKTEDNQAKESGLPSQLDQKQMDKMFELLVKPEVKNSKKKSSSENKKTNEKKGYDNKDTNSLNRLIDITTK